MAEQAQAPLTITLRLTPASRAQLDELRAKVGADSDAEVIARALKLYDGVVGGGGEDARMVVTEADGSTSIVRLFERAG